MSQYSLFLTLAPIAAAMVIIVAGYAWLQARSPLSRALTFYMLAVAGFLLGNIGELISGTAAGADFFTRVQYIFWPFISVLWLRLALLYTGQVQWAGWRRMWLFSLLPLVTVFFAWSDNYHHLIWAEHTFKQAETWGSFSVQRYGPWFWANGFYFYLLLLAGALLMVLEALRAPRIFRFQSFWMVAGAVLPLTMNLIYIFHLVPSLTIDFTPLAFALAGLAFVLGILRHRLLSLSPIGRAVLIESMLDPMLVLDDDQRVIDLNPAAQRFLGVAPEDCLGKPFSEVWPDVASIALPTPDATRPLGWTSAQHLARRVPPIITTPDRSQPDDPQMRSYELHISPLHAGDGRVASATAFLGQASGWLVVLHDLTLRRQAEESLADANRALAEVNREVAEKSEALARSNDALTTANSALTEANTALHRLNEELEERVAARTESLRQRAAELEVLTRISDVLRQSENHNELLHLLVNETAAALGYSAGALMLAAEDGLRVAAVCNLPQSLLNTVHPPHYDAPWRALKTGRIVFLDKQQLLAGAHSPAIAALDPHLTSGVMAPMQAAGRSLGVLAFFYDSEHAPTQEWPLSSIAEMGANAIQRVRMMETLEQLVHDRTRDLSTLYEVTTTTNQFQDLDTVLARILEKALDVLHGRVALVHLLIDQPDPRYTLADEPRENQVSLQAVTTIGLEPLLGGAQNQQFAPGYSQPGPWSTVFERGSILVVPDIFDPIDVSQAQGSTQANQTGPESQHAGKADPPSGTAPDNPPVPAELLDVLRQRAATAYVGVPIHAKGRTLGVLSVFGQSLSTFSAEDIALLAAIADHVGGAVENAQLRQRAEQAAVVDERQRLARDLHDSVTQSLYSQVLFSEAGCEALDPANLRENDEAPAVVTSPSVARAHQMLKRLSETSQQALKELRLLIFELRPLALQKEGLTGALRSRLETVEQRAGIRVLLAADQSDELPLELQTALYAIAQEALNNTLKHSRAQQVTVRFEVWPEHIELEVSDDGCGFLIDPARPGGGIGLSSMRERAAALGGTLAVRSEIGRGTSIMVTLQRPRQHTLPPARERTQQQEVPDDGSYDNR